MRRRDFLKTCAVIAAGTITPAYRWASAEERAQIAEGLLQRALPLVGTGWHWAYVSRCRWRRSGWCS